MRVPPNPADVSGPRRSGLNRTGWGIIWMILATAGFVTSDTIVKHLLEHHPVSQVVWARYATHFLIVLLLLHRTFAGHLRTQRLPLQLFRSALLISVTVFFYMAIAQIPLATASAIIFMAPIIVTLLSGPILGEKVGVYRWTGVVLGFIGALVILQPGGEYWDPAMIWAMIAAFSYALYQITTRALNRTDSHETTIIYTSLMGMFVMAVTLPFAWETPTLMTGFWMIMTGAVSAFAHYALISAFFRAPASVITPYGYTSIIWATLFGYVLFAEVPGLNTYIGAAIIVASGIYILHREKKRARQMAESSESPSAH